MRILSKVLSGSVLCILLTAQLPGANRLLIEPQTVSVGQTNVTVPVRLDNDQPIYGFSLSLTTNASLLKVTDLDLVGTPIATAEWSFGEVLDGGARLSWGVVIDLSDPFDVNKFVPTGPRVHIANLKVDVTAAAAGAATVNFQDVPPAGQTPGSKNVLAAAEGTKVPFTTSAGNITIAAGGILFKRGDSNGDGRLDIADAISTLGFLFQGTAAPPCKEAANANDDVTLDLTDAIVVLGFLFQGGTAPASPGPTTCGPDRPGTPSDIGCISYAGC